MPRIKVLVVDDSVVVRRAVTTALSTDPEIEVVGTASSGRIALERVDQLLPDLVTLDIEMPDLDGLETLRQLRRTYPRLPVVMFSSLTERGAAATLDALSLGANDYVTKPSQAGSPAEAIANVTAQLVPKIKALCPIRVAPSPPPGGGSRFPGLRPRPVREATGPVDVVAIGASTGGPDALVAVLRALPADFPLPVLVVQHMPALFTRLFAQRLDQACSVTVTEGRDGVPLEPGVVHLAPGDFHLGVRRDGATVRLVTHQEGPENWVRPAVDVLFRSVAEVFTDRALAVVLTGMGQDGIRGAERLRLAGAQIVVQDAETSVVWGMPGAVANAGLADRVLPLGEVAGHLMAVASRRPALRAVTPATSGRAWR